MIYNLGKVTYDQLQGNEVTRFTASIRINAFDSEANKAAPSLKIHITFLEASRSASPLKVSDFIPLRQRLLFSVEDRLEGQPVTWQGSSRDFTDIHVVIEQWAKRFSDNFQRLNTLGNVT